ncbi:hypothetical protein LVJ94_34970 [Pendulispora rubella]|uniref:Uncharacterized protein n=1 Tax=Pendulispora rubella TaxID=2741070 RepID=A0ABZ2KTS9_9BACT
MLHEQAVAAFHEGVKTAAPDMRALVARLAPALAPMRSPDGPGRVPKLAAPDFGSLVARAAPVLKNVGSLGGVGALGGAATGAGYGILREYARAGDGPKRRGQRASPSLQRLLVEGIRGAGTGAMVGGALGAGAGALARGNLSTLADRGDPVGAAARFGLRQVHGLTGVLRPEELEWARGGAYDARRALQKAILRRPEGHGAIRFGLDALTQPPMAHGDSAVGRRAAEWGAAFNRDLKEHAEGLAQKTMRDPEVRRAQKAFRSAEDAQNLGLTSIPGYIRAVLDKNVGLGKAVGTSIREQFHNQPRALTTLGIVPPAVGLAGAIVNKTPKDGQGRGRVERGLGSAADLAGGLVTGAMPIGAGQLVSSGLRRVGSLVGRGIDRLHAPSKRPATPPPEASPGQSLPLERVTSARAAN